jgi:hypothetical protein
MGMNDRTQRPDAPGEQDVRESAEAELQNRFHDAMVDIYRRAKKEAGYNATRFLQLVGTEGGLRAAQQLLASTRPSEGFTALWERDRLDLTVEACVLRSEFMPLFSQAEIDVARDRLRQYGYEPPPT